MFDTFSDYIWLLCLILTFITFTTFPDITISPLHVFVINKTPNTTTSARRSRIPAIVMVQVWLSILWIFFLLSPCKAFISPSYMAYFPFIVFSIISIAVNISSSTACTVATYQLPDDISCDISVVKYQFSHISCHILSIVSLNVCTFVGQANKTIQTTNYKYGSL